MGQASTPKKVDNGTADADRELVLSASKAINDTYARFENSKPDLAAMLVDRFAEAVADFVRILERQGIYLVPPGYDSGSDFILAFKAAECGLVLKPTVGVVHIDENGLSMAMTGPREVVGRLLARRRSIEASFGLIMSAHFSSFANEVSKS